ncbi:unnamed protein product [Aureobasidium vineae]|uniref:Uncharacterized protein n=1 Tax=Aureobasidium vineae TaxID=2773715 RepID=A0A9N8JB25_9PEZI|nr:unnamed protein product [Aureobasidium vineae]
MPEFALRKPEERRSYYGYGREQEVREPALDGHNLSSVVQHCMKLGLDDCINQLIGRILQEITVMDTKDFPTAILPLLESLLSDIKKGEIQAERFRRLFQSSLVQYIARHVGEEPKQANWSREPIDCEGKDRYAYYSLPAERRKDIEPCPDCQQMNKFNQDPKETVWRYPAAEKHRDHLKYKLEEEYQCSTTVERTNRPFILVVTKHKKGLNEKHRKWASRVAEVKLHPKELEGRHRFLEIILAEKYSDIMVVRASKLTAEVDQAKGETEDQISTCAGGVIQSYPSSRGQKRKAVVIDLTDDWDDVTHHVLGSRVTRCKRSYQISWSKLDEQPSVLISCYSLINFMTTSRSPSRRKFL